MDSELVSGSESDNNGGGGGKHRSSPPSTYTMRFQQLFPFYLALGMTYEQYWDMDSTLVKDYRKSFELRQEMDNQAAWLQGMYFYEALCCVAPIFRPFSKAKKPIAYRTQPYPLKTELSKMRQEQKKKKSDDKAKSMMEAFMVSFNKKFEKKGG